LKTISEVSIAAHGYQAAIAGAGQKRLAGKIAEINDGLIEAREPYAQKRNELLKELREFARKEINQRRRA
jgi:hypothetical protein